MLTYNHFLPAYGFFSLAGIWSLIYWQVSDHLTKKAGDLQNRCTKLKAKPSQHKALAAYRKAYRSYWLSNLLPTFLLLILMISCLVWTRSAQNEYELSLPEGWLTATNEPSPPHTNCMQNPTDAVFIYFGTAAVSYAPSGFTEHTVVKIGGHNLLSLNQGPQGVTISAKIFDPDGILVEIDHGHFKVYRSDFVKREHLDTHTLAVYDKWNNERVRVRYLNPLAIGITGSFFYPGYPPVVAKEAELQIAGNRILGGTCIGGNGDADIVVQ